MKDLLPVLVATYSTGNLVFFAYSYCCCFVLVVG